MRPIRSALVTGATGFIGRHLVRRLTLDSVTTYCLIRARSLTAEVSECLQPARCLPLRSDSTEGWQHALENVEAEVVFHLASPGVTPATTAPQELIESNVGLMCRLLTAVAAWPLRKIIHTGSFSEYASTADILSEDSPLMPATAYGASKAAAWLSGRALALHYGLPLVNLRLFHVYGPGEASNRLIPYLHDQLSRGQPARLTTGAQIRDLVHIDDVVEALVAAIALPPSGDPAAYNVSSGTPVTVRNVGELVARQLDAPQSLLRWGDLPYRFGESMRAIGDNRRFVESTGWVPRICLEDGISHSLANRNWARERRAG